jgi:hypothetical protein
LLEVCKRCARVEFRRMTIFFKFGKDKDKDEAKEKESEKADKEANIPSNIPDVIGEELLFFLIF